MAGKRHAAKNTTKAEIAKRARVPASLLRAVPGKTPKQRAESLKEFKRHGFRTAGDRYVVVDGPRDGKRNPIKGARVTLKKGGVVVITAGNRKDYIYGFTRKEKKNFAAFPEAFLDNQYLVLAKTFPSLKKARKPQVRLQWGAYQATKDFAPNYFTAKYFAAISPEERREEGKKAKPRGDKLTGMHVVIHSAPKRKKKKTTAKKKTAAKKTKGAKRGRGKRNKRRRA